MYLKRYLVILVGMQLIFSIFSVAFFVSSSGETARWEENELDAEIREGPAPPGTPSVEHHGDLVMGVFDDFSDRDYTSDPGWSVYEGDWSADRARLEGQGRISTDESVNRAYGRWEYDFSLESIEVGWGEDDQKIEFYFIQTEHPDPGRASGYLVRVSAGRRDGEISLLKAENGDTESLAEVEWDDPDTDWHTLRIERDEANTFTVYLDGDVMIEDVRDHTFTYSEYKGFMSQGNSADDNHNIDEIRTTEGREDNLIRWDGSPDDPDEVIEYDIYRSENEDGAYEYLDTVDADGSASYEYIDEGKGELDDTYWWYQVRSVGEDDENPSDPVREPGPPLIEITSPQAGEVWKAETQEEITWITEKGDEPIDSIDLWYSTDSGESWNTITTGLEDGGSYRWKVPNEHGPESLIRGRVRDEIGRLSEGTSEEFFSIEGIPPEPPRSLTVDHHGPIGESVENGAFIRDYEPWELEREQDGGEAGWDEESYQEGGSVHVRGEMTMPGFGITEESYWEQEIDEVSTAITVNGAFRKDIDIGAGSEVNEATVEILVHDTQRGWQSIYRDEDTSEGDTGWVEFGPDMNYDPVGSVDSIRAYMHLEIDGIDVSAGLWMDEISVFFEDEEGKEHNVIAWEASKDDPEDVDRYNIYRSENRSGPWNETTQIVSLNAVGSEEYSYLDEDKGMADDIYWWYVVRAVGENGLEENNTDKEQEPAVVDHIEISPQESELSKGESQEYTAASYDEEDNEIRYVTEQVEWSIEEEAGGTWDENVYTSEHTGTWNVTGRYTLEGDEFEDTAALIVLPTEVVDVEIDPEEDQEIETGTELEFTAEAYDDEGEIITADVIDFTWDNIHELDEEENVAIFFEEEPGEYEVSASFEDVTSESTRVIVEAAYVDSVEIDPSEDQIITAGETIDFEAEALDPQGDLIEDDDAEFTWENADENGLFDKTEAGGYEVSATYQDVTSPLTTVTVEPAGAEDIEIYPKNEDVTAGEEISYEAEAYDGYGNEIGDVTDETEWSDDIHDSGWEDNELTPYTAGEWTITGEYQGIERETALHVEPADIDHIDIDPEEQTIPLGEKVTYHASSYDEYNNEIEEVTEDTDWSIEEGAGGSWTDNEYETENPGEWNVTGIYSPNEEELECEASLTVLDEGEVWVDIISPEEGKILPSDVMIDWVSENVEYHEIRLNEVEWIDVGEETRYIFEDLEEGDHQVEVKAVGEEMNVTDSVDFTVDHDILHVDIVSPEENERFFEGEVTVEWISGNAEYHEIRLNEDDPIHVGTETEHTFEDLAEGEHLVEVEAVREDRSVADSVSFVVETEEEPLSVEITSPEEDDIFADDEVTVEWEISGEIRDIEIRIDEDDWEDAEMDTQHTFEDLTDKEHTIEVRVTGEDDNSDIDSVSFIVDTIRPEIEMISPEEGETLEDTSVMVKWNCTGGPSGLDIVQIRLNEEEWEDVSEESEYTYTYDLEEGEYTIEIRAVDNAGNEENESVSFEVSTEEETGFQLDSWACLLPFILLIVIVLALIILLIILRGGKEEKEASPYLEKKEPISLESAEAAEEMPSLPEEEDEEETIEESEWMDEEKEEDTIDEEPSEEAEDIEDGSDEYPVPEDLKEPPVPEDIAKEEAVDELSKLKGIGSSKAERLYENDIRTLDDLRSTSKEELQEIKGIGPALSEKILDSLEDSSKNS